MFRIFITTVIAGAVLSGCTPKQMTYAEAMAYCQDKADAAAGPQGSVGISVGTGGTRIGGSLSVSDSFIRGDDPKVVYDTCMNDLSINGQITGASE